MSGVDDKYNERETLTKEWETFLTGKPPEKDFGDLDRFLQKIGCEQILKGGSHCFYRHDALAGHQFHGTPGVFQIPWMHDTSKHNRKVHVVNVKRVNAAVRLIIRTISEEA